jgi:nucleotide-binding universal stress UspA family protein
VERVFTVSPTAISHIRIDRILCAVTFSPSARRVVAWAASLAGRYDGEVRLFHAIPSSNEPAVAEGEADSERVLRKLFTLGHGMLGRPRISAAVAEGDAAAEILQQARMVDSDLIAIGMHARDGSVSPLIARIAIDAPCPVLVVDETASNSPRRSGVLHHVVAAVNFLPASFAAADYAFAFAQAADAWVTSVYVLPEHWEGPPRPDANVDEARQLVELHFQQLLQLAVDDVSRSSRGRSELVTTGQPCVEIVRIANACDADLIVLGIDRQRADEAFGETTSCVSQLAGRSVLLVPERLFRAPRLGRMGRRNRPH